MRILNKKIFFILIFLVSIFLFSGFVYAACPGDWYCDNTVEGATKECGEVDPGTYNGSFAGKEAHHYWNTTMTGPYVNFSVSIKGQGDDDLDLYLEDSGTKCEELEEAGEGCSSTSPFSDESISICSVAGTYRSDVFSFSVSDDACAPYNIAITAMNQDCCDDADCPDYACSLDTCSEGSCTHCTLEGENAATCGYPCCSGLQQCFDGICREVCPDFSISLDSTPLTILRPLTGTNSNTSTVNITSINDFNYSVSLSGDWIGPSGVSFSYNPSSVIPPVNASNYSDLTVTIDSTASLGTFTLRTYASSGSLTHTADLTVNIIEVPFDFNVSVDPSSGSVEQGDWTSTTVYVTLLSGSTKWVSLSLSGCPPDATCSLSVSGGYPTYTSTLNISTSLSTPNKTYTITITGTGGGLTRSATYTLTVEPYPGCIRANPVVSISPTYHYGYAGQTETYTVSVTNKDSTACGESTFSLEGLVPEGFSYSFSQPNLVIKPVGFANSNWTYFYVTSNCTSREYYYHKVKVNVTNTNDPRYFSLASAYYYVYSHFYVSIWDSPQSGVSGSMKSYRVYIYNYKWTTCPSTTFSLTASVPSGWSYALSPSSVTLAPRTSTTAPRFKVTSPCSAAPGSYTIRITATDTSTGKSKTASGIYTVLTPSCKIRSTPFFDFGPFDTTLTATFYNLNTTCFPTATLECGQGKVEDITISGNQASTGCSYPAVAETTYYTTRANVSANSEVSCQTIVVDNPDVFNFSVSVTPEPDYNGLVGFWSFDEGWGISTADRSGNNNNGSLGVTNWEYVPAWTLGRFGYGLGFDGNDYVEVPHSSSLNIVGYNITLMAWIKPEFSDTAQHIILNKEGTYEIALTSEGGGSTNTFAVAIQPHWTWINSYVTIPQNSWAFVAAIYDGRYTKLYVNGTLRRTYDWGSLGSITGTSNALRIGARGGSGSPWSFWRGIIDEVKVLNRALSEEEILREYKLSKVYQDEETFALIPVTLLSGNTQPVSLSLTSPCLPNSECNFVLSSGNPTYTSVLNVSTSPLTPTGTYTITITGKNGGLTRNMNYTIEVLGECIRSNPSLSISPLSQDGDPGEELSYSIYLTNNDNAFCSPSTFSLELNPLFDSTNWKFDRADWLSGWQYRQTIKIDNTQNPSLTDYQVLVEVDTASLISEGKMLSDCEDIRFTDSDGSLLNYYIESGCNSDTTRIWVKIPSIPAFSTKNIYIFYRNTTPVTSASNGDATFDFFDDFDDGTIDSSKWTEVQYATEENGYFRGDGANQRTWARSTKSFDPSIIIEFEMKPSYTSGDFDSGIRVGNIYFISDRGTGKPSICTGWCYPTGSQDNNWHVYQVKVKSFSQEFKDLTTRQSTTASYSYSPGYLYLIGDSDSSTYDTLYNWIRVRKYTSPEPTAKIGITLNPQGKKTINLNITSPSTAGTGTYTFNLITSSGIYSNSTTGSYIISMACPPPNCTYMGKCYVDGECVAYMKKCDNGNIIDSCGDGACNCGENEETCSDDCVGVYFKLYQGWNLISLPYKSVIEVSGDSCEEDRLYFYFWKNKTWKKVLGIKNIEGGYGYWVNPEWFTKTTTCSINVTTNKEEAMIIQDIPELKKGYNTIGAPNETISIKLLKNCSMPIKLYWNAYYQEWKFATSLIPEIGYWIYVENETCKLSL